MKSKLTKTAIEELTSSLLKKCSTDSILNEISENDIILIIETLVQQQFIRSDDNGRLSQNRINKTLDKIVDDLFKKVDKL